MYSGGLPGVKAKSISASGFIHVSPFYCSHVNIDLPKTANRHTL